MRHVEQFWKKWQQEYLLSLLEHNSNVVKQLHKLSLETPKWGDFMQVSSAGPSGNQSKGKIMNLIASSDEQVRAAFVRLPFSQYVTTFSSTFPLECKRNRCQ